MLHRDCACWMVPAMMAACAGLMPGAHAQCALEWSDQYGFAGDAVVITDSVVWDDGTGPALYAVGTFRPIGNSGGVPGTNAPQYVARWDAEAQRWRAVGGPFFPGHVLAGVNRLNCITTFDPDGPGGAPEVLVVGGRATVTAGGQCIAAWDGTSWSSLGSLLGTAPEVRSLTQFDADGAGPGAPELYAVGNFRTSTASTGSNARLGIARWNGTSWSEVDGSVRKASGSASTAHKLAVYNGELFVGGDFDRVGPNGSITALGLAKWNGVAWSAVPGVVSGNFTGFFLLKTLDLGEGPALLVSALKYAGQANPVGLAQYKDGVWSTVLESGAPPYTGQVFAAEMFEGSLYIGGRTLGPITPGDTLVTNNSQLFRRTSEGWENVGNMGRLTVAAGATGQYDKIDSASTVNTLTRIDWDGSGPGAEKLFVAGQFAYVDERVIWSMFLLDDDEQIEPIVYGSNALGFGGTYNNNGTAIPNSASINVVKEIDLDGNGPLAPTLIIAGQFASAGTKQIDGLVGFDGADYAPVGNRGTLMSDFAIRDVFRFEDGGDAGLYIARADAVWRLNSVSNNWEPIDNAGDTVKFLQFPIAGQSRLIAFRGSGCDPILYLDGSAWGPLTQGMPQPGALGGCTASITDAVIWDDGSGPTMYATLHVPRPTEELWSESHIIRWNTITSSWEVWGDSAISNPALAGEQRYAYLSVFDGSLYVTGSFSSIDGVAMNIGVARRVGASWEQAAADYAPDLGGTVTSVSNIAWHDFGAGTEMVVRGRFAEGGLAVAAAGRWNGSEWATIPGTIVTGAPSFPAGTVFSIESGRAYDGLYFTNTGRLFADNAELTQPSYFLARLNTVCTPCPACAADYDNNGGVDGGDLAAFFADFEGGETCADVDQNGGVDGGDLGYFFQVFEAGGC